MGSNSESIDPSIRLPRNILQALRSAARTEQRTVPVQAGYIIGQWLVSQGYMSAPAQHQNVSMVPISAHDDAVHNDAVSMAPHADKGVQKTGKRSTQDDAGDEKTLQPATAPVSVQSTVTASATASRAPDDPAPWWKDLRLASGHPPSGKAAAMLEKSGVTSWEEALAMDLGSWRIRGASNAILAALDKHRYDNRVPTDVRTENPGRTTDLDRGSVLMSGGNHTGRVLR